MRRWLCASSGYRGVGLLGTGLRRVGHALSRHAGSSRRRGLTACNFKGVRQRRTSRRPGGTIVRSPEHILLAGRCGVKAFGRIRGSPMSRLAVPRGTSPAVEPMNREDPLQHATGPALFHVERSSGARPGYQSESRPGISNVRQRPRSRSALSRCLGAEFRTAGASRESRVAGVPQPGNPRRRPAPGTRTRGDDMGLRVRNPACAAAGPVNAPRRRRAPRALLLRAR